MSKKFIGGLALGLVIPCVAGGVCLGVPSVRDRLFKTNNDSELQLKVDELEKNNATLKAENSELKNNNSTLSGKVTSLTGELETTKETIKLKDEQITTKENQVNTLTQEKASLQSELDRIKALVGQDINYVELVTSLQSQLEEKTTALTTATAELEQLRVDKTTLETRVNELETELAQVKEELSNYKSIGEIDKLNISNFNGTWYLNGTFADYFTIENGVVTHNANTDKGLLNVIYNQMYIMMNSTGGKSVELSTDGTSFITADGNTYTKFYINTVRSVVPVYMFAGEYNNGNETIKVNADNTITLKVGDTTYNGAYTVTTVEKNVGGNISNTNTITATFQVNGIPTVKTFTNNSRDNFMTNSDGVAYTKVGGVTAYTPYFSKNTVGSSPYVPSVPNYIKVTVKTPKIVKSSGNGYISKFVCNISNPSSIQWNGSSCGLNSGVSEFYFGSDYIPTNMFTLYFHPYSESRVKEIYNFGLSDVCKIAGQFCEIVDFEIVGLSVDDNVIDGYLKRLYNLKYGTNTTMVCSPVVDYINGTYTNEDTTISLKSESATVGDITATTYIVTATTDGTDIFQTVNIEYTTTVDETSTNHTLVLTFKNSTLLSSKLDNADITLSKNN